jgi:hypothetical protein
LRKWREEEVADEAQTLKLLLLWFKINCVVAAGLRKWREEEVVDEAQNLKLLLLWFKINCCCCRVA